MADDGSLQNRPERPTNPEQTSPQQETTEQSSVKVTSNNIETT